VSEAKRLFLAINLPEEIKNEIYSQFSSNLPLKECKVVDKGNLHITLKFIGYMGEEGIEELKEKINGIEFPKFEAGLENFGSFRNRVVWVGVGKGSDEISKLAAEVNNVLKTQEERFHPHVTIARNKFLKREQLDHIIETLGKKEFGKSFEVESIDLMESELSQKGPKYSLLFKKELL